MNSFNSRIRIDREGKTQIDEYGSPFTGWSTILTSFPAQREIVKFNIKDIANRPTGQTFNRWLIRSCQAHRTIREGDRIVDLSDTNRIHEVLRAFESEDRKTIIIESRSNDAQAVYK